MHFLSVCHCVDLSQAALLRASAHVRLSVPYWIVNRSGLNLRVMSRASKLPVAGSRAARTAVANSPESRLAFDPGTPRVLSGNDLAQPTSSRDREVLAAAAALLEPEVRSLIRVAARPTSHPSYP